MLPGSLCGRADWSEWAEGLPHYWLPNEMKSNGAHQYNGKTYYVVCKWNGCKAWNKPAFDCEMNNGVNGANGCDTGVRWFAFGQPRLRGPGYDTTPYGKHHRDHFYGGWLFGGSILDGLNGGYLTWDNLAGGYNAVVLEGHSYEVENTAADRQLTMTISDPIMDYVASPGFGDVVSVCVKGGGPFHSDGTDAACWLTASDDRTFVANGLRVSKSDPRFVNWTSFVRTEVGPICGVGEPGGSSCSARIKARAQRHTAQRHTADSPAPLAR